VRRGAAAPAVDNAPAVRHRPACWGMYEVVPMLPHDPEEAHEVLGIAGHAAL
jgi:hypothetical protein